MLPFRISSRSLPFLNLGRCLMMAPPEPLARFPSATLFLHAWWPPMISLVVVLTDGGEEILGSDDDVNVVKR